MVICSMRATTLTWPSNSGLDFKHNCPASLSLHSNAISLISVPSPCANGGLSFSLPHSWWAQLCVTCRGLWHSLLWSSTAPSQAVLPYGSSPCAAGRRPLIAQVFSPAHATCSYDSYFLQIGDNYYTRATGKTPLQSWSRRGVVFLWLSLLSSLQPLSARWWLDPSIHRHSCGHTSWKDPAKGEPGKPIAASARGAASPTGRAEAPVST